MNIQFRFSDKLTSDEDHLVVALNTMAAIENSIMQGLGITPDHSDSFTNEVTITNGIWDVRFCGSGTYVRIPDTPLWVSTFTYNIYNERVGGLEYVAVEVPFGGATLKYFEIITNNRRNS